MLSLSVKLHDTKCMKKKENCVSKGKENKTGVINDPLGQSTVPAGSDCRLILKFWDGQTYGRTDGHSV